MVNNIRQLAKLVFWFCAFWVLLGTCNTATCNHEGAITSLLYIPAPVDTLNSPERDSFLNKMDEVLEKNYSKEDFKVPDLCKEMCMAHPTFFRKVTRFTGKNIEDNLRSFRLKKAHEMLCGTPKPKIQEVAWNCGFCDLARFSRSFKKEFGVPPSMIRCP